MIRTEARSTVVFLRTRLRTLPGESPSLMGFGLSPRYDLASNDVTRENPLTAGVPGCKVVSMSPWETSRPPYDMRVWFGPGCGEFYGREGGVTTDADDGRDTDA